MVNAPTDHEAAELAGIAAALPALVYEVEQARQRYAALAERLGAMRARYDYLAARIHARAAAAAASPAPADVPAGTGAVTAWPGRHTPGPAPEASPRTVQNLLFILGGLLLGSAAVVFTAVAWASFGVAGRAAILALVTGLTLLVPPLVLRRGLTATAETFAAVGLLLVMLDGYAAWYVNLAGLPGALAPGTYAGVVAAATAAAAAGYAALTGLVGPRLAALLAAQPVLPLLAIEHRPGAAGWAALLAVVAVADLLVADLLLANPVGANPVGVNPVGGADPVGNRPAGHPAVRAAGWALASLALTGAAMSATEALATADRLGTGLRAGAAATLVAAVLWFAASRTGHRGVAHAGAAVAVAGVAGAAARVIDLGWPRYTTVAYAAVVALGAAAVAVLPRRVRTGPWLGVLVAGGVPAAILVTMAWYGAAVTAATAFPVWRADLRAVPNPFDWQVPAALALLAVAALLLLGRRFAVPAFAVPVVAVPVVAVPVVAVGAGLVALAGAAAFPLPWWAPSLVDGVVLVPLAVAAALTGSRRAAVALGAVAGALALHAIVAGLGRPESTAVVLAAFVGLAAVVAVLARRIAAVRAVAVAAGVLAVPGLAAALGEVFAGAWSIGGAPAALGCALLAVIATTIVLVTPPIARSGSAVAAATAAAAAGAGVGFAAVFVPDAPFGVVAAVVLLCDVVLAGRVVRTRDEAVARFGVPALVVALIAAVAVMPVVVGVLFAPYAWLAAVWSDRVAGPGIVPGLSGVPGHWLAGAAFREGPAAIALGVLTAVAAGLGWLRGRAAAVTPLWTAIRWAVPPATLAALAACAALHAPWPAVPVVSLASGLGSALLAALRPGRPGRPALVVLSWFTVGAGVAGSLATRPMTLAALAAVVVGSAVCGAAGRTTAARVAGWCVASASGAALAFASAAAVDLPLRGIAYWLLVPAGLALATSVVVGAAGRRVEARVLDAAAHATAAVAFLLTLGWAGYAASISTLWGIAVGLRALAPEQAPAARRNRVVAAAGLELLAYWLLLASNQVAVVEAYTVPAAAVAVLAGWLVARRRPGLASWKAYGPALVAGFAPSLASVLAPDAAPLRRLVLGVAAVLVVLVGAGRRLRAPVLTGGAVLVVLALRETAAVWDLIPRWAPLAVAGLVLVALATTYERRRRDLARLRDALGHMR